MCRSTCEDQHRASSWAGALPRRVLIDIGMSLEEGAAAPSLPPPPTGTGSKKSHLGSKRTPNGVKKTPLKVSKKPTGMRGLVALVVLVGGWLAALVGWLVGWAGYVALRCVALCWLG